MVDASAIGTELKPLTFDIEKGKIEEFARAIREDNPVYYTGDHRPAPLTFTRMFSVAFGEDVKDLYTSVGVDVSRIVRGGQDFEFLEPVRAGDTLTMTGRLADVYTKEGKRGGTLQFVVWEWTYVNQHGRTAVRSLNTTIVTSKSQSNE